MAGYIFSISKSQWNNVCEENIKKGYFTPYTPEITTELLSEEKKKSRTAINKVLAATLGDFVTMKPGDNIYFLSNRKIYGVGHLVTIGIDCKYDNYLNASALIPNCLLDNKDFLTTSTNKARWVCFFEPDKYFFKKGVDMDDILRYRPEAFKMLRAFEDLSFIKVDDEENRALKEYVYLANEFVYSDLENQILNFDDSLHKKIEKCDLEQYLMDINSVLNDNDNKEFVISEMLIEAALLQLLSKGKSAIIGNWDYLTHQVIASPFKPLKYIDKMDIFGYRYSTHYSDSPKLISKYLLVELKRDKINEAALEQTMQYVDWVCSEYASGDYSRIEAYVIGDSAVRNVDNIKKEKCQRDYIIESHPVKTEKWSDLRLLKYCIDGFNIKFEPM